LDAIALIYAKETMKTSVRVNVVNPGPTRTEMRSAAFPGEDPSQLPAPDHITETMIALAEPGFTETGLWIAADAQTTATQAVGPGDEGSIH